MRFKNRKIERIQSFSIYFVHTTFQNTLCPQRLVDSLSDSDLYINDRMEKNVKYLYPNYKSVFTKVYKNIFLNAFNKNVLDTY